MFLKILYISICLLAGGLVARAEDAGARAPRSVSEKLKQELEKKYPAARIEMQGQPQCTMGTMPLTIESVLLLGENARGQVQFVARGNAPRDFCEGIANYAAWMDAHFSLRRIMPGELLKPEMFVDQRINVAAGQPYEYRGVIMPADRAVGGLETRQSVLEGQYLLSSSVQRIPDVRRGDMVQIHLRSGGLLLTTFGTAEEPGYADGQIRVMSKATKKELVGRLGADRIVEVTL